MVRADLLGAVREAEASCGSPGHLRAWRGVTSWSRTCQNCVKAGAVASRPFSYNHNDGQAMFSAAANRANKARSGKHGEYSPVGK